MKIRRVVVSVLAFALAVVLSTGLAVAAGKPAPAGKVNINTASAEQLEELPGVGAKLAARIVEYRQKSGGFKKVEDLMNIQGIGERNFLRLKPLVTVTPPKTAER
jgi:competence protein ComEA